MIPRTVIARCLWLAWLAAVLAGCNVLRVPEVPVIVRLEVWNRTLDPMFLLDPDGRVLSVDACGDAVADQFRVNDVTVRTDAGYVFGFGSAGSGAFGSAAQYLVLVAADGESFPTNDRPVALPACQGHPHFQPGV